jgi:hypothetical protein
MLSVICCVTSLERQEVMEAIKIVHLIITRRHCGKIESNMVITQGIVTVTLERREVIGLSLLRVRPLLRKMPIRDCMKLQF